MANKAVKRERTEEDIGSSLPGGQEDSTDAVAANSTTNFRNVSACNRCRTRKNRCDQKLPRCTGCEKARVKCVGFDPVSKRTIPRSYVYYLETRLKRLEEKLGANGISFEPPEEDFSISEAIQPGVNVPFPVEDEGGRVPPESPLEDAKPKFDPPFTVGGRSNVANQAKSSNSMISVPATTEKRHTPAASGVSFARVVFAAVRSTISHTPTERTGTKSNKELGCDQGLSGHSARDSFFGLHTRPAIEAAPFPDEHVGRRLADLYFEYANPQIPILHRGEFMALFEKVYQTDNKRRTARELYFLNIVFAIGSGIIMDSSHDGYAEKSEGEEKEPKSKRPKLSEHQHQPEEYHASAVVHLESFLASPATDKGGGGGLEELQAVCLMAGLALLRPVAPGLWYIIGSAVRLAVDLGLHSEDADQDSGRSIDDAGISKSIGRKQWARDLRRRLWWCVYSFDRLVSTCVGRPFGITDQVVTTEFPSLLDDRYITKNGLNEQHEPDVRPTYKLVAHHYFRLRLLQSEMLQVLQHRQAEQARSRGTNHANSYIHKDLISPFAGKFASFQDWRVDVDRRLWEWKENAPRQQDIGVAFTPLFLELNYWQAVIMLYRQSLAVPEHLADITNGSADGDVSSPGTVNERREDEEMVLMKVAQAGQTVLKLYRQLHRLKLVNYTYLATHHLFMSGISFLYAIWHSPLVRSQLTLDDVDFTVLVATSVLDDLIAKCPPAEACREAFVRMSKATIAMVESSTGFGAASILSSQPLNVPRNTHFDERDAKQTLQQHEPQQQSSMPQFDMDLKALFSEEEIASRPLAQQFKLHTSARRPQQSSIPNAPSSTVSGAQQQPSTSHQTYYDHSNVLQQSPTMVRAASQQSQPIPFNTSPSVALSNPTHFASLGSTLSSTQVDYSLDTDMSFLSTVPVFDPNDQSTWGSGWNDFDSFTAGGTGGWDGGAGDWGGGLGNGVDMFDGFFFGEGGGGN